MKKLNSKQVKYLSETLTDEEIQYVTDINNTLYRQNYAKNEFDNQNSLSDIEFIAKIFGYSDKFKMFHWSAMTHSMHTQIDDFYSALESFKDAIAENIQGINGQFEQDVITKIDIPGCTDPIECINNLKDCVLRYMETTSVKENPEYEGVRNICSGFMETVYKYIYLLRLCKD